MDCSQLVLNVIKDPTIKANLNPIAYYTIKLIYAPNFSERSRYFSHFKLSLKTIVSLST